MANTGGGSFIPKRSTGRVAPVRSGRRVYVLSYIAYVLFFGTLLSVVGIFFLHNQAETQLQKFIELIDNERQAFQEQSEVNEIKELDTQLSTAMQILNWHAAPSVIFEAIEDVIVQTVQLEEFDYTRTTGGPAELSFGGKTSSFDVLLFQREVMADSNLLASADIVEVSYGAGGELVETNARQTSQLPESATVMFTFEDISSVTGIRYTPRVFEQVQESNPEENAEATETTDIPDTVDQESEEVVTDEFDDTLAE